jgi:hypothetical protein
MTRNPQQADSDAILDAVTMSGLDGPAMRRTAVALRENATLRQGNAPLAEQPAGLQAACTALAVHYPPARR